MRPVLEARVQMIAAIPPAAEAEASASVAKNRGCETKVYPGRGSETRGGEQ